MASPTSPLASATWVPSTSVACSSAPWPPPAESASSTPAPSPPPTPSSRARPNPGAQPASNRLPILVRLSQLLLRTLRDAPSDADAASHALLVRAGYIRRVSSGIYTWLPLGRIVLRRVETIIREEIEAAGGQELLLPVMQPIELWEQSGRTATMEDVLFRVEGRGGEFALGATGEEAATLTVAGEVDSYRALPLIVYQVQLKYRDEPRARFGVVRGREFLMMDAYSFDASKAEMIASYDALCEAYRRIFTRLGLEATPVEAVAGAIGGDVNHEWMVPSPIGEDHFARCDACNYAANIERAEAGP